MPGIGVRKMPFYNYSQPIDGVMVKNKDAPFGGFLRVAKRSELDEVVRINRKRR